jgi:hypothetical protein
MIKAGVCVYCSADEVLETHEEIVCRIYKAMWLSKTMAQASRLDPP